MVIYEYEMQVIDAVFLRVTFKLNIKSKLTFKLCFFNFIVQMIIVYL